MLSQTTPIYQPYAPIHQLLGAEGFSSNPTARVAAATRAPRSSVTKTTAWTDGRTIFPWMPHATGAVNAWALLILPGPGADADPFEETYDWSPGFGAPARHLAEFPYYPSETVKGAGHSWAAIRRVLGATPLPGGVDAHAAARLACWGVANLTAQHARREHLRTADQHAVRVMRAAWVLGTCQPRLVAVVPGDNDDNLHVVEQALEQLGLGVTSQSRRWEWQSPSRTYALTARTWRADGWATVVCRLNQHPSLWVPQPPRRLGEVAAWAFEESALEPARLR
jgi:hypothetical protein